MSDREDGSHSGESYSGSIRSGVSDHGSGHEEGSIRQSKSRSRTPTPRSSHSHRRYSRSRSRSRSYDYRRSYRSRSRSYSPYHRKKYSRYSRSRSRSYSRGRSPYYRSGYSDRRRGYARSHSRSPMSNRRRHVGNRDDPREARCVGVFGLSLYTQERELREHFDRYGPIEDVQIVYDRQTGRSRGFCFIYYRHTEDAVEAKERAAGTEIDGRRIRVDYSITQRAHTPTPGIYLGKPTTTNYRNRRSPSPCYRRRSRYSYSRSRSRSYSPRREEVLMKYLKNET